MKKALLFLCIVLPIYLFISLYFLDKDYFLCPIEYKSDIIIRSDSRGNGFFAAERKGNRLHQGIDLSAEIGTPVRASRSGRAQVAKYSRGIGNYIVIRHPGNITTLYGHLSQIYVSKGKFVRQGEVIGAVGKTGNAKFRGIQPHLHFEVRKESILQDPLEYLQ